MKNIKAFFACFFLFTFFTGIAQNNAYPDPSYKNSSNTFTTNRINSNDYLASINTFRIVLNSDSSTKSVLVSNIMDNKAGDMSPILGAATWFDNDEELQCRSLLEFNLELLPIEVRENPSLIRFAELVLYPLNVEFAENDNNKMSFFYVRQILQRWNESTTMWKDQPLSDSIFQTPVLIEQKDKDFPANIDVTTFVKKMIKKENNGFMIFHDNEMNESLSAGQLFASPKNANPELRPQLIIYFESENHSKKYIRQYVPDYLNNETYSKGQQNWWIIPQPAVNTNPYYSVDIPIKQPASSNTGGSGQPPSGSPNNGHYTGGHSSGSTGAGTLPPVKIKVVTDHKLDY
ncbi:MAG: DNRLRE domain-containing protein [Chitinophagaceae bacterium]|nr:DNRLRE domain-containing protein [Chitinophagaceae bacterium]